MKKNYKSIFTGSNITAAQYIAELVCYNRAEYLGINLPHQFYKVSHWRAYYLLQMKSICNLLEEFEASQIIKCVRSKKIWSIAPAWVKEEIAKTAPTEEKSVLIEEQKTDKTFKKQKDIDISFLD